MELKDFFRYITDCAYAQSFRSKESGRDFLIRNTAVQDDDSRKILYDTIEYGDGYRKNVSRYAQSIPGSLIVENVEINTKVNATIDEDSQLIEIHTGKRFFGKSIELEIKSSFRHVDPAEGTERIRDELDDHYSHPNQEDSE